MTTGDNQLVEQSSVAEEFGSWGEPVPPPSTDAIPGQERPAPPGYEILAELGRGAMGVVYKARQTGLNRLVALKMILHAHRGTDARRWLQAEAEAVARLQHPHIVQIYEIGEYQGAPFFSLEFCPGGSLADNLAGKPLPARQSADLVRTLAGAINSAHDKGIIHRDLKPGNVLLSLASGGSPEKKTGGPPLAGLIPKITDFGLAKRLDQTGDNWVGVMGTPGYMAPEQADAKTDLVGPASDVYSLGAILYECLTGRPPFMAAALEDMLEQIKTQDPVPPRQWQPSIPRDLETICLKCLSKAPQKRYSSAKDLVDDLARFLSGEPIKARPVSPVERAVKWVRRRPMAAALVLAVVQAVLGLAVGGVSFGLYQSQQREMEHRLAQADRNRAETRQKAERLFGEAGTLEVEGRLRLERKQEEEAGQRFSSAEKKLTKALAHLDVEKLEDEQLRKRIISRLEDLTRWRQMRRRVARLRRDRHDILLHEISPISQDQAGNIQKVLQLAPAALAPFGVTLDRSPSESAAALGRGQFSSTQERKNAAEMCYEVLLAWADAASTAEGKRKKEKGKRKRRCGFLTSLRPSLGQRKRGLPGYTT
jgi:tRNA A-37 threonylcarbamoyl transferase component Bud32